MMVENVDSLFSVYQIEISYMIKMVAHPSLTIFKGIVESDSSKIYLAG
jgi:hypothetical protein